jgi:hypothetical protein
VVISLTEVVKDYASDPFHLANDYVVTLISTAGLRLERQPALFCSTVADPQHPQAIRRLPPDWPLRAHNRR